jgi:V/A-type H+-transporting ATPase subunit A
MTEPVTAHTQRFVRSLWTLDRGLAYARHYPAVNWSGSFSRDAERLAGWHTREGDPGWSARRAAITALLGEADRLASIADLVGAATMPGHERIVLLGGRLLREGLLQQSALSPRDAFCSSGKGAALADLVLAVVAACQELVASGVPAETVEAFDFTSVVRAREQVGPDDAAALAPILDAALAVLRGLT